jgi:acetylornithine deacetylase/succinyl-diaminopimelate desuccinylase-like protein
MLNKLPDDSIRLRDLFFINDLNLPVVSAGVGYPDNRGHAPNEHIRIHGFVQGIRHTAYIIEAFGRN